MIYIVAYPIVERLLIFWHIIIHSIIHLQQPFDYLVCSSVRHCPFSGVCAVEAIVGCITEKANATKILRNRRYLLVTVLDLPPTNDADPQPMGNDSLNATSPTVCRVKRAFRQENRIRSHSRKNFVCRI